MSQESIYKFVEKPEPEPPKKIRYRSKYDPNGPLIGSTFGTHGTTVVDGKGFHALKQVRWKVGHRMHDISLKAFGLTHIYPLLNHSLLATNHQICY